MIRKGWLEFFVLKVLGSLGKFQSGQMGQTVNLLSYDFGGSNPPFPTVQFKESV